MFVLPFLVLAWEEGEGKQVTGGREGRPRRLARGQTRPTWWPAVRAGKTDGGIWVPETVPETQKLLESSGSGAWREGGEGGSAARGRRTRSLRGPGLGAGTVTWGGWGAGPGGRRLLHSDCGPGWVGRGGGGVWSLGGGAGVEGGLRWKGALLSSVETF